MPSGVFAQTDKASPGFALNSGKHIGGTTIKFSAADSSAVFNGSTVQPNALLALIAIRY